MNADWIALLASFVYVFAMIGVAEGLRKWRGKGPIERALACWRRLVGRVRPLRASRRSRCQS
jgi:hypothetical protein